MKRSLYIFSLCIVLLLCLPLQAFAAIDFDGNVMPTEWLDYPPVKTLSWDESWCGITFASIRYAVQTKHNRVMFGFTAVAPGIEAGSAIGAAFLVGGQEIGYWQQDLDSGCDSTNYDLRGMTHIPENSGNNGFTLEFSLGYKNEAALSALQDLSIQLYGPQGIPSQEVACPIVLTETTNNTERPTTTEKTTTTKEPTTEKTTTTKPPTTEKITTTKAATTEKTITTPATEKNTATLPVTTTRSVYSYTPAPQTKANSPAAPQAETAAPAAKQSIHPTQPGTSRTEVFYYTMLYTDATAAAASNNVSGLTSTENQTLWTYASAPTANAEMPQPGSVPTLAMPASQPAQAASPNAALLFWACGLLVLLAAGLVAFWLRVRKKPETSGDPTVTPAPEPSDSQT